MPSMMIGDDGHVVNRVLTYFSSRRWHPREEKYVQGLVRWREGAQEWVCRDVGTWLVD
jgi:hypothetical protein